ncbi:MAG: tRNA-specific adenosine deaminase [Rhodospirillaceae bacterium]|nr:tRNA-specific adenosine deaminase [Rhodospirillaceae bacterium]
MDVAFEEARRAAAVGEVPVGAVVIDAHQGTVIARAHNLVRTNADPTAHAEILALREAAQEYRRPRLVNCDLFVTLEPCIMCAQAIALARIRRLVFAAYDPKAGGVEHGARVFEQPNCNHRPEVIGGVRETAASDLLKAFFENIR